MQNETELDCQYCHGDPAMAKIAQRMGYRPDVAFARVQQAETALRDIIEESEIFLKSSLGEVDVFIFSGMIEKWKSIL